MYEFEQIAYDSGAKLVCGVDEAGRGPLAGDVYAAAVVLPQDFQIEGLRDSKKLSAKQRDRLYDEIIKNAVAYHIASASVAEIAHMNILQASLLAMRRAVEGLSAKPDYALVDGNQDPKLPKGIACLTIVGGDDKSASVAAASILAKVERDRYMQTLDQAYPQYMFHKHKGYGTKLHYEKLREYGISPVHRMSFLKKFLQEQQREEAQCSENNV